MAENTSPIDQESGTQLRFAGQPVRIEGDIDLDPSFVQEIAQSVTEMEVDQTVDVDSAQPRVIYSIAEDISVKYDQRLNVLFLKGPIAKFGQGTSVIYLAEYLAANTLAGQQGTFLTHAAATYNPETNRSQLLLGEKGAGKTTLAIRVCKEGNRQLVGNDQVYIGSNEQNVSTLGGNGWFNIRKTAIDADEYLRQAVASDLVTKSAVDTPSWNDKIRLEPESLGINRKVGNAVIDGIFHVRIDHTQKALHVAPWRGVQRNLILHERLGRHISGQATPLQDDSGNYLGSLPLINHEIATSRRDELVRKLSAFGVTEIFAPDSASATHYILGLRDRNI